MRQLSRSLLGRVAICVGASSILMTASAAEDLIPLEDLVRNPKLREARISPTGEYLAVTVPINEQVAMVVLRTSDLTPLKVTQLPNKQGVGPFYWSGPERLVFAGAKPIDSLGGRPGLNGSWYAVDADGDKPRSLIEYGTQSATQKGKSVSYFSSFSMRDPVRDDDGHVLMQVTYGGSKDGGLSELVEVDTYSGRRKTLMKGPDFNCGFALTPEREARFASCTRELDGTRTASRIYLRENDSWKEIYDSEASGVRYYIERVVDDGRALAYSDDGKGPSGLGWFAADGSFEEIFREGGVDAEGVLSALDGKTPLGVFSNPDYPAVKLFDNEHPDAVLYRSLASSFPGKFVRFASATADGKQAVVVASGDRDPGSFYLFDRESGKARFLLKIFPWLDEDKLAEVRPFKMKARDGVELRGYLTIPAGHDKPSNLPMIVNPHGGPYGPRDEWAYSPDTQILASRGYLVLQVNFRGSGGYGEAFTELGHRQWGGTMQDDVTDATLWAVQQGYANADRICIYGGSYGGYAALMGVAKEPDMYKCAAGNVGVYDMPMMYQKGDIRERDSGQAFLKKVLGTSESDLIARSPNRLANQIKASVFLSAGNRDDRAPAAHTIAMYDALKKAGNPVEERDYILQSKEGHGFYNEANKLNYYTRLLDFFNRNLAPIAEAGEPVKATAALQP